MLLEAECLDWAGVLAIILRGVVEVENPEHCDFVKLRSTLITHMQDLQEVTHDVHYENFRSECLATGGSAASTSSGSSGAAAASNARGGPEDKDKVLAEKDAELRRMQEMLAKMQEQMKQQSSTNLAAYNN